MESKELICYSEEKARRHYKYHHYTDFNSLIKIIESKSFLASTGFNMNDQLELTHGMVNKWKQLYFTSFSYGSENIAMWGLYCFPRQEAVCISIDNKRMNQWIEAVQLQFGYLGQQHQVLKSEQIKSIRLVDVYYTDEQSRYLRRGKDAFKKETLQFRDEELTGLLKDTAWHGENEVRLLIELNKELKDYIDIKIFSKFNQEFLKNLHVMFGPWVEDSLFSIYKAKLIESGIQESHITRSKFTGLLKMKSPLRYMSI